MNMQSLLKKMRTVSHRYILHLNFKLTSHCMHSSCKLNITAKELSVKYGDVINDMQITHNTKDERIRRASFGAIRLDIDNNYNEINPDNIEDTPSSIEKECEIRENLVDQQYFNYNKHSTDSSFIEHNMLPVHSLKTDINEQLNIVDDQYFNVNSDNISKYENFYQKTESVCVEENSSTQVEKKIHNTKLNFSKQMQEKPHSFEDGMKTNHPNSEDYVQFYLDKKNYSNTRVSIDKVAGLGVEIFNSIDDNTILSNDHNMCSILYQKLEKKTKKKVEKLSEEKGSNAEKLGEYNEDNILEQIEEKIQNLQRIQETNNRYKKLWQERKEQKVQKEIEKNLPGNKTEEVENELKTAYDVAITLRSKDTVDSKERYKKILKSIPNFHQLTRYDIIHQLKHSVVFKNDNLIALSKPYGIEMHNGASGDKRKPNLVNLLPELAERLYCDHLYPVHRLDATTTGVLLLARTELYAAKLKEKFKKGEIDKTYITITKGVPKPAAGIINIFIGERKVQDRIKMEVKPDMPGFRPKYGRDKKAITKFEVLSSTKSTAVVEIKTLTGVKHQIRVHLASGLKCPILGDHKYSHPDSFAPQRLDNDTLQRLQIKQSRVRDLPIFLHASSIFIPDVEELNSIKVFAKIPDYFLRCFKILGLGSSRNRIDKRCLELISEEE